MYDLERFKNQHVYIKLETKEKYNKVMEWLEEKGVKWEGGTLPTQINNFWELYKEQTSITHGFNDGVGMQYAREQFYKNNGYTELLPNDKGEEKMKLSEFYEKYGDQNIDEKELKEVLGIKDQKHFKPKYWGRYWFVDAIGNVHWNDWNDSNTDFNLYNHTELYRTEEEAEFARDENQFLLQMKRDFEDNSDELVWENDYQKKFTLHYDGRNKRVIIGYNFVVCIGTLYTTNEEWLEQYIKDNEENILKHYFEIKE